MNATELAHEERFWQLKLAEMRDGVRDWYGLRQPFRIGERVLLRYPAREGTVITYEESSRLHGNPGGEHTVFRTDDGRDAQVLTEFLVSLDYEGKASAGQGSGPVRGLSGVDRRPLPPAIPDEGRRGRLG